MTEQATQEAPTELPIADRFKGGSIKLKEVTKSFGRHRVLEGVSFEVASGEVVCMIGPSGSGKSTALRCINRLEEPSSGDILLDGESTLSMSPDVLRQRVGMVFQQFNLFPHRTVLDNMTLPLRKVSGLSKTQAREGWSRSGWDKRRTTALSGSPAANSNEWRSPGRWRCNRRRCCSTRRPAPWTRNSSKGSSP
jgi:ABC-type proline/glycine betaine transport system ATPase subunit